MKNVKNLQEELNKELNNKRLSDAKIQSLTRQIQQEKQNKKLPKDIEKAFKAALGSAQKEMEVLTNEIAEKQKAIYELEATAKTIATDIAEKYGVPVYYSILDTEYRYGPESYQDKWAEYEVALKSEFSCMGFYPAREGWSSSSC